jgi:plasmid stabilization system protein ParE
MLPRAAIQLYESAAWWAENRSVEQAARWLGEIETAIAGLASEADRYPKAPESEAFEFSLYQMNFGISAHPTHPVIFSFDETRVVVYAIRHLSQTDFSPRNLE